MKKSTLAVVTIVNIVIASAVLYVVFFRSNEPGKKAGQEVTSASNQNFSTYNPKNLPEGYVLDRSTKSTLDNVVSFVVGGPSGESYFVSQQKAPNQSVIDNFNFKQITNGRPIQTNVGEVVVGKVMGNQMASYVKNQTWILVSTANIVDEKNLLLVITSLD